MSSCIFVSFTAVNGKGRWWRIKETEWENRDIDRKENDLDTWRPERVIVPNGQEVVHFSPSCKSYFLSACYCITPFSPPSRIVVDIISIFPSCQEVFHSIHFRTQVMRLFAQEEWKDEWGKDKTRNISRRFGQRFCWYNDVTFLHFSSQIEWQLMEKEFLRESGGEERKGTLSSFISKCADSSVDSSLLHSFKCQDYNETGEEFGKSSQNYRLFPNLPWDQFLLTIGEEIAKTCKDEGGRIGWRRWVWSVCTGKPVSLPPNLIFPFGDELLFEKTSWWQRREADKRETRRDRKKPT